MKQLYHSFCHRWRWTYLTTILPIFALATLDSCSKSGFDSTEIPVVDEHSLSHDEIVLGQQLDNPYTVENVKAALESLYPTKAPMNLQATDLYVRFLPKTEAQLNTLKRLGIPLMDHPMDYTIECEGDFYHDPALSPDSPTWQYSVVPVGFDFPFIEYEVLDECYIAPEGTVKSSDGIDWEAVEAEAFRLTGNESMLCSATKAEQSYNPTGRIMIIDDKANGGQPFGVAGVRIDANVFTKYSTTTCDRDGYFTLPKKYSANPRYRLVFKNETGFSIGFNSILYPASVSTLGKNSPKGLTVTIDSNSERKLFRRCAVNNAVYDYLQRCSVTDLNIETPPSDVCIWCFDSMDVSSAAMLHHGTYFDAEGANKYFQIAFKVVQFFAPDITLGTKDLRSYSEIYSTVVHELAHASHFASVGKTYWNNYIGYIVSCAINGMTTYGDGQGELAGYCAVGEMWAYFLAQKLTEDRYPYFGASTIPQFWFHPVIFSYLNERGLSVKEIFAALTPEVTSVDLLKESLLSLYPSKRTIINQVFGRYE